MQFILVLRISRSKSSFTADTCSTHEFELDVKTKTAAIKAAKKRCQKIEALHELKILSATLSVRDNSVVDFLLPHSKTARAERFFHIRF